jgi:hypothetical protein
VSGDSEVLTEAETSGAGTEETSTDPLPSFAVEAHPAVNNTDTNARIADFHILLPSLIPTVISGL